MPLASSGALSSIWREAVASARNVPHNRAYHLNAPSRSSQTGSIGQRLLRQTRSVVQAFVGHLTTPGTLARASPAHSLHHLTRGRTIESGLSLHVRNALAQPLGAPKLPRPPTVPRNVFQVGLGSARKFSTGRPIFAHLAENVPVTGRALAEADFDPRLHEEKRRFMKENLKEAEKNEQHAIRVEKLATPVVFEPEQADAPIEAAASELERYFPAPAAPETAPGVTTTLLVPLAPSPSSRLPLPTAPKNSSDSHPIVPFAEMSTLHYDFTRHNDRVAALFLRLDGADVWSQGARCDAYGDTRGGANVLRVAFEGWDAQRVRAIIGETGSGWCVLEEDRELDDDELDEALAALEATEGPLSPLPGSRADSPVSPLPMLTHLDAHPALADFGVAIDPSHSFVLPTLDFSSSFAGSTSDYATDFVESELEDGFSDPELLSDDGSDGSWNEVPSVVGGGVPSGSWLGFSSAFEARMNDGPMEEMF